ncbi:MAG: cation:proton antiporter [Candidatus Woesearchaeota archaeon]
MNVIFTILILLAISYVMFTIAKKLKIPVVVALIISGVLLGLPQLRNALIEPNTGIIAGLGDIALIALLFMAGMESNIKILHQERKESFIIAISAAIIPFLLGFLFFILFGFPIVFSAVVGICLSITAEGTKARVLLEMNKLKSKLGSVIMETGIIDDLFGLTMFIIITYIFRENFIREDLLLIGALMAFFFGLLVQKYIGKKSEIVNHIENFAWVIVIPFFFISMGLLFDIEQLLINPSLLIFFVMMAIAGKLIGTLITKPFVSLSWNQLYVVGWAMNSRGAIELALAQIALKTAIIGVDTYSALVGMALISTLIFPFILSRTIKKHPRIMG